MRKIPYKITTFILPNKASKSAGIIEYKCPNSEYHILDRQTTLQKSIISQAPQILAIHQSDQEIGLMQIEQVLFLFFRYSRWRSFFRSAVRESRTEQLQPYLGLSGSVNNSSGSFVCAGSISTIIFSFFSTVFCVSPPSGS
jgi:hypothetical protein